MPDTSTILEKTYNSLSGVDIKAVFHNKAVVPLQAISYAIQREKAPIYTMGHPDPRAFSRGKRGIAGTLIFAVFDRHALVGGGDPTNPSVFRDPNNSATIWADAEEVKPSYAVETGTQTSYQDGGLAAVDSGIGINNVLGETSPTGTDTSLSYDQRPVAPWYSDQIPPFNIVLTGANELGTLLVMRIYGVEILNEGYGISIDDLMSEMQMTYVCRAISPWSQAKSSLERPGLGGIGSVQQ